MHAQSRLTLCNPMGRSPPSSSVHGIFQERILEQAAISFTRGSSRPRDWTRISCVSCIGRKVLYQLSHQGSLYTCCEKHLSVGNIFFAILERLRQWNATVKGSGIPQSFMYCGTHCGLGHARIPWALLKWDLMVPKFCSWPTASNSAHWGFRKIHFRRFVCKRQFDFPEKLLPHWICFDLKHLIIPFTVKYIEW